MLGRGTMTSLLWNRCLEHMFFQVFSSCISAYQCLDTNEARARVIGSSTCSPQTATELTFSSDQMKPEGLTKLNTCNPSSIGKSLKKSRFSLGTIWADSINSSGVCNKGNRSSKNLSLVGGGNEGKASKNWAGSNIRISSVSASNSLENYLKGRKRTDRLNLLWTHLPRIPKLVQLPVSSVPRNSTPPPFPSGRG